ncbi:cilia- and flagella-associated protein 251 [Fundulus heteroclitus]|uniref:cilia- and flagella-associated protein 251 n=1 Tax=Fundulus heteroclitus TaxID=8078 RepID=UPI00165BB36F|nr:cilia- and flagella-associated protein 251 [Fundulus heteroclitus]
MTSNCHASLVLTIMVLFTSLSFRHLSTSSQVSTIRDSPPREVLSRLTESENKEGMLESLEIGSKDQTEQKEELFEDVDPKRLAAVLLEALNHTFVKRERNEGKYNSIDGIQTERDKINKEKPFNERVTRERDQQKEVELLFASQGKDREREEEEVKKKALEEERITEKVTSQITSQMIQIQTNKQFSDSHGTPENDGARQQGSSNPVQNSYEKEELLNPEELKSLETMMKEFPRLNTERYGVSELKQRHTRGYKSYNGIIPTHKGSDLTMTKKKLKWQEETQKGIYFPTFNGDDSIEDSNYISKATQLPSPTTQEEMQDDDTEEKDYEEMLSPKEEEAQANIEQEEMMRQAAEAKKAKMEEEKLADIASDMLLSYMVKQNKGDKKHNLFVLNAAEDKRSDENQKLTEEDDIDPQTIDKLIEISSKLHLPANDVVDIIIDVEKKKKDLPSEMTLLQQDASSPLSPSFHSSWHVSTNQNSVPVSKIKSPPENILKMWFQETNIPKSDVSQRKLPKTFLSYHNLSPKPEKPFLLKQERWFKLPRTVWPGYYLYPYSYSTYQQRKPILGYYPYYFPPVSRPKPKYYLPKPAVTLNNYFGNSKKDPHNFPPKRHYQSLVQRQLKKSYASPQHMSFYSSYYPVLYYQPFQRIPASQAHSPPQTAARQEQFLISALELPVIKNKDYHEGGKQPDSSVHDDVDVEKYIQQSIMNRAQRLD